MDLLDLRHQAIADSEMDLLGRQRGTTQDLT
jgi:hypothetical protein